MMLPRAWNETLGNETVLPASRFRRLSMVGPWLLIGTSSRHSVIHLACSITLVIVWIVMGLSQPVDVQALTQDQTTSAGVPFRRVQLDGSGAMGELVGLNNDELQWITESGESQAIPAADVARLETLSNRRISPGAIECQLVDGSVLAGTLARISESQISLSLRDRETPLAIDRRDVALIRFSPLGRDAEAIKSWEAIVAESPTADRVVVTRRTDEGTRMTAVEGVIGDLTEAGAAFKFDDQEIVVGFDRLEALLFYHPPGRRLSELRGVVQTFGGQRLLVRSWEASETGVVWSTIGGAEIELELDDINLIDFEAGRVMSLVDLEPTTLEWTPFVIDQRDPNGALPGLSNLFAIEKDVSFLGTPLTLFSQSGFGGTSDVLRSFERGLALRSQTRLVYRVPEGYSRLVGWLGIDPDSRPRGHVAVKIAADGQTLWEGVIQGSDPEPVQLDLDITDASRLLIMVEFGEGGDLGDRLHWCEPRLVK